MSPAWSILVIILGGIVALVVYVIVEGVPVVHGAGQVVDQMRREQERRPAWASTRAEEYPLVASTVEPRPAPGYIPAELTTPDARPCGVCGEPMPFGVIHACGLGADYRPERVA